MTVPWFVERMLTTAAGGFKPQKLEVLRAGTYGTMRVNDETRWPQMMREE